MMKKYLCKKIRSSSTGKVIREQCFTVGKGKRHVFVKNSTKGCRCSR